MVKFNFNELTWDDTIRDRILERIAGQDVPHDVLTATHSEVMASHYSTNLYKIRFLGDQLGKQIQGKVTHVFWERQIFI